MSIKNVILLGATGNLGPSVVKALQKNPAFNLSILAREGSATLNQAPQGIKVLTADYNSRASLVAAFKGQDAVVSMVGSSGLEGQIDLIDAAIEAGVQRFIPSEFGSDTLNEKSAALAIFQGKVKVRDYLSKKAEEGKISYTLIISGPFFDWASKTTFLGFDVAARKAILYDGGSRPFSVTILPSVGQAVDAVLSAPEKTKNRSVFIHSAVVTQRKLLSVYERLTGEKWVVEEKDTVSVEKETNEKLAAGDYSTIYLLLYRSIFGEGYGGEFKEVDNEDFGIKLLTEGEIEDILKETL